MRKRLLVLATALAFACLLAPGIACADEGTTDAVPVAIEIGSDGAPLDASGTGWEHEGNALVLEAGYTFTFTGHPLHVSSDSPLLNYGVIEDGSFVDMFQASGFAVSNEASGVIRSGTFAARVGNAGIIAGGTFNGEVWNGNDHSGPGGTVSGGTFAGVVNNFGIIEDGTFNNSVHNGTEDRLAGTIEGGTFNDYVTNSGTIADGLFEDGGRRNSVDNDGVISGGSFGNGVRSYGTISDGRFSQDVANYGTLSGGAFDGELYSTGTLSGGTFNGDATVDGGTVSGGIFSAASTVTSYGPSSIIGGTFAGTVVNGDPDEPDAVIAGGTFTGTVANCGTITGGVFERPVVDEGGSLEAGFFPLLPNLNHLAIGENAEDALLVPFAKGSDESIVFTLAADEGYALPSEIELHLEFADGALTKLTANADYTYDAATGALTIKKSAAAGPLRLAASGVAAPKPEPTPADPDGSSHGSGASPLASTGDGASTLIAGSVLLASGSVLALCAARRRSTKSRR